MDETYKIWIAIITLLLLGAVGYKLWGGFKTAVKSAVDEQFKDITDTITGIDKKLAEVDKESCKNFLVRCLSDIEKGDGMTETEAERFWEQYDHYTKDLNQNTYIKEKVQKLKAQGKI